MTFVNHCICIYLLFTQRPNFWRKKSVTAFVVTEKNWMFLIKQIEQFVLSLCRKETRVPGTSQWSQFEFRLFFPPFLVEFHCTRPIKTLICFHSKVLTCHGCGCRTWRWAHRAQSPPGWRAWPTLRPVGAGADHPPSWKTASLIMTYCKLGQDTPAPPNMKNQDEVPTFISLISNLLINRFVIDELWLIGKNLRI